MTDCVIKIRSYLDNGLDNVNLKEKLSDTSKRVLVINSGGTISDVEQTTTLQDFLQNNPYACDADYTYFKGNNDFLITPLTAFNRRVWYKIVNFTENKQENSSSNNLSFSSWFAMAQLIQQKYSQFDGFIILHATDTMAYTACALSFLFLNLSKPVILTGSQMPLSQSRTDGFVNFLNSLTIAGHFNIPEVLICFQNKLLRGNRSQNVNSFALDSFDSTRFQPIGEFGVTISINWDLILKSTNETELKLGKLFCKDVALLRVSPFLEYSQLHDILQQQLKGIVIETYGAGNMQTEVKFQEEIKKAAQKGIVIVNISQCHTSKVQMIYETGIIFQSMGVINGGDMTVQAALTKLSYLLGQYQDINKVKELMQKNIRGEITERTTYGGSQSLLGALQQAFQQRNNDVDLNRDLILPNVICQMIKQGMKLSANKLDLLNANYQSQDYDKRTILHIAARDGAMEVAETILKKHPQMVNCLDRWEHSPMFDAVISKQNLMISLLLRFQGKLIAPLKELTWLLMEDINKSSTTMLQLFYEAGERDFSKYKTNENRTIAHLAASLKNIKILNFLARDNIIFDWSIQDFQGRTAKEELNQSSIQM